MNRIFSFLAGIMCGVLVGATTALLLAPASGESLRADVNARVEEAIREARLAMEQTRRDLENQFEQMKQGRS